MQQARLERLRACRAGARWSLLGSRANRPAVVLALAAVCAGCAVASDARAQTAAPAATASPPANPAAAVQRVAVVRMSYGGDIPKGHQETFEARLVEGLAVVSFQVFAGDSVQRKMSGKLARCADADCYPKIAQALDVGYLLVGKVEESNKNYDVTLDLINGRTGATIGKAHERCETCGVAEAAERVALTSAALRRRLETLSSTPARVVVRSTPAGATANVNGKGIGRTPVELDLPGGAHRLTLELAGYNTTSRSFTVVSGVEENIDVELLKPPGRFAYRAWGFTALGVGAALLAAGTYAAIIDGKVIACADEDKDVNGLCPRVRDTDALAGALFAGGAGAATLGGVWLWLASEQAPAPSPEGTTSAGARTIGLRVTGRF